MLKTQPIVRAQGKGIPALGLGTWTLENQECVDIVEEALHLGYRHVDTAQAYDNEESVGKGLQKAKIDRENIFLTTKVWFENFEPSRLKSSVEDSLKKLKTDYVDLLLLHWPVFDKADMRDVLDALMKVRQDKKALTIGVSNFTTRQLQQAQEHCDNTLVVNQVEYHPFLDQSAVLKKVKEHDMALTAYSPLARGEVFENETLDRIAKSRDVGVAEVVLAWLRSQDQVIAIPKTTSKDHLKSNLKSLDLKLSEDEIEEINKLKRPDGRVIDPDFAPDWD